MKLIYTPKANLAILKQFLYVLAKGYPKTAHKFYDDLYNFGNNLAKYPGAHAICRQPQLAKRKMRCAIFKKNYIFIYRVERNEVVIYNVVHGRRNQQSFTA